MTIRANPSCPTRSKPVSIKKKGKRWKEMRRKEEGKGGQRLLILLIVVLFERKKKK
jgi:hypothetical protein